MRVSEGLVPLAVASAAVVGCDVDVPVLRPVLALVLLVAIPVWASFHLCPVRDRAAVRLMYAAGLTLLGLVLGGLVVNTALPAVGADRPLQPAVLGATALLVDLALVLGVRGRVADATVRPGEVVQRLLGARWRLPVALGTAAVVLAVAGAVRLNNGAGGSVAVAALALVVVTVLVLLGRRSSTTGEDLAGLGLAASALLLATSLRGWTITGHDIQSEFLAFRLTDEAQRWDPAVWENAYNACLSITILPTVLSQATGLSGLVVFKVLLQLAFALVPPMTYLLARRFLDRRAAVASAAVLVAFPTFYTDMPYLVRQEVAFLFVALMLLAATASDERGRRVLLVGAFGTGVVVSHYSTTYVLLISLLSALAVVAGWRWWNRRRGAAEEGTGRPRLALVHPAVVVLLAVGSWAWAGPVTNTGGHALEVTREAVAAILGDDGDEPGSSDRRYGLWWSDAPEPEERLAMFVEETFDLRETVDPELLLLRDPGPRAVEPEVVEVSSADTTPLGETVDGLGVDPGTLANATRAAAAALIQLLVLVGGVVLALAFLRRRVPALTEEVAAVVAGTAAALAVVVVVPSLSVDYGVLRAFQQSLLVLSPVVVVGVVALSRRLRVPPGAVVAIVPVVLLATLSGLAATVLGGNQPRIALANAGLYYERYAAADSDVDAVHWMGSPDRGADPPPRIVANRNLGVRILSADREANVDDRLFPTLLARGDHVLVDSRLAATGRSSVFYTGDLITYRYPLHALRTRLDLVYASGRTEVYR